MIATPEQSKRLPDDEITHLKALRREALARRRLGLPPPSEAAYFRWCPKDQQLVEYQVAT